MSIFDGEQLDQFLSRFSASVTGAMHAVTVLVGDRLGFYEAMADGEPLDAGTLAGRTGTSVELVSTWLASQVDGGYLEHDSATTSYRLPPQHAALLVDGSAGVSVAGAFRVVAAAFKDEPLVTEAYRTGEAPRSCQRHPDLSAGLARCRLAAADPDGTRETAWALPEAVAAALLIDPASAAGEQGADR